MMAENRKNTIEAKSTYEKELESQQRSASAKGPHAPHATRKASMTNEQRELESQQRSANVTSNSTILSSAPISISIPSPTPYF